MKTKKRHAVQRHSCGEVRIRVGLFKRKYPRTLNIPRSSFKSGIRKRKDTVTTTKMPRVVCPPKVMDQVRRALIWKKIQTVKGNPGQLLSS